MSASQGSNTMKRMLVGISTASGICLIALLLFSFYIFQSVAPSIPDDESLGKISHMQASMVYSSDDHLLGRFYVQDRTSVSFEQIPVAVLQALVATEDVRFYDHHGIDWHSLMRVFFKSILANSESSGGGSTISQQLAKNLFPRQPMGRFNLLKNKIREMITAYKIENIYTKNEIATLYLNTVPFGNNTFGIESAATQYFGKHCGDLQLHEAALLIGILKATTYYNPINHPERATTRRNVVLDQMVKAGYITTHQADSTVLYPPGLVERNESRSIDQGGYLLDLVRLEMLKLLPVISDSLGKSYNLYTDGLRIHTSINGKIQQYAQQAVTEHMTQLQKRFEKHWGGRTGPWENAALLDIEIKKAGYSDFFKKNNIKSDSAYKLMNTKKVMDVFTWAGSSPKNFSVMDSIKYYLKFLNTGFVAIHPNSGAILGWVGGIDHTYFKFDHAGSGAKRQVGSTFKPIVYATALEQGLSPCEYIKAEQEIFVENNSEWRPSNTDGKYEGKYSMEGGLTHSVNTVSVKILEDAGIAETIHTARLLGIESPIPAVPSIALGTPGISLVEMTGAYAAIANNGAFQKPYIIDYIEDGDGNVLWRKALPETVQALSRETAMLMLEMLAGVVNRGTASALRSEYMLRNDIAGKTGTTQNNADGWFIASIPELTVGIWVGGEYPSIHFRSTALGQGAVTALPIYGLFMQKINRDATLSQMTASRFQNPPAYVLDKLDCDPFREDFRLFEWLFGRKKADDSSARSENKGILKKMGNLFRKKKGG